VLPLRLQRNRDAAARGGPERENEMSRAPLPEGHIRKLIEFDAETRRALQLFSRESMRDLQELAESIPGFSDADKVAMLGGTAAKLLGIN
jgi:hypothetical protein